MHAWLMTQTGVHGLAVLGSTQPLSSRLSENAGSQSQVENVRGRPYTSEAYTPTEFRVQPVMYWVCLLLLHSGSEANVSYCRMIEFLPQPTWQWKPTQVWSVTWFAELSSYKELT